MCTHNLHLQFHHHLPLKYVEQFSKALYIAQKMIFRNQNNNHYHQIKRKEIQKKLKLIEIKQTTK